MKRDDERTWGNEHWPVEVCRNGGFMGKFPYWKRMKKLDATWVNRQPQAWRNRENPLIYEAFANVLQTRKLWVSIDRYGVMRPAHLRHQSDQENEAALLQDRQTKKDWLHWDLSPFHFGTSAAGYAPRALAADQAKIYGSVRVQGLVALVDCPVETGGFHCVPGFTNDRFFQWAKTHEDSYGSLPEIASRNFIEVPEKDPMRQEIQKVPLKAGSLLIWNSQLPHGYDGLVRWTIPTTDSGFLQELPQYRLPVPHGAVPQDDPCGRPAGVPAGHEAAALREKRMVPGRLRAVASGRETLWLGGVGSARRYQILIMLLSLATMD